MSLPIKMSPENIKEACLAVFIVSEKQLNGALRKRKLTECRTAIAGLISKHVGLSAAKISMYSGNRHRTTVAWSIELFKGLLKTDRDFKIKVLAIEKRLDDHQIKLN